MQARYFRGNLRQALVGRFIPVREMSYTFQDGYIKTSFSLPPNAKMRGGLTRNCIVLEFPSEDSQILFYEEFRQLTLDIREGNAKLKGEV